jgi:hypothetical protein
MSPGDFFSLIDDGTPKLIPAVKLLQVYGKEADRDMLRDFYYQDDRRAESACLELEEAGQTDVGLRMIHVFSRPKPNADQSLQSAEERLQRLASAVKYFSEDKERIFETRVCLYAGMTTKRTAK